MVRSRNAPEAQTPPPAELETPAAPAAPTAPPEEPDRPGEPDSALPYGTDAQRVRTAWLLFANRRIELTIQETDSGPQGRTVLVQGEPQLAFFLLYEPFRNAHNFGRLRSLTRWWPRPPGLLLPSDVGLAGVSRPGGFPRPIDVYLDEGCEVLGAAVPRLRDAVPLPDLFRQAAAPPGPHFRAALMSLLAELFEQTHQAKLAWGVVRPERVAVRVVSGRPVAVFRLGSHDVIFAHTNPLTGVWETTCEEGGNPDWSVDDDNRGLALLFAFVVAGATYQDLNPDDPALRLPPAVQALFRRALRDDEGKPPPAAEWVPALRGWEAATRPWEPLRLLLAGFDRFRQGLARAFAIREAARRLLGGQPTAPPATADRATGNDAWLRRWLAGAILTALVGAAFGVAAYLLTSTIPPGASAPADAGRTTPPAGTPGQAPDSFAPSARRPGPGSARRSPAARREMSPWWTEAAEGDTP